MKAMLLKAFGGPENFVPAELPLPEPGPGQVRVRIAASSVNPVDTKLRARGPALAPPLPALLGADVAGVVDAVGPGVNGFAAGDRVYGCVGGLRGLPGTYAEYVAADARLLAPAPATLTLHEAAALPLVALTAWEGLIEKARVAAGQRVLVIGGTGGVGHVALQIARGRGAHVTVTATGADKQALARRLGADAVLDLRAEDATASALEATGGHGYDIVFDTTGGNALERAGHLARLNGQVIVIVARFTADLTVLHERGLSLHAVHMLIPMQHDVERERHGAILREVAALADGGRLRPLIDARRFALADVAEAHRHLEAGQAVGKIVLTVDPALAAG